MTFGMNDVDIDKVPKRAVIVGAGLVGILQGLYLIQRGFFVSIFDRCVDPRLTAVPYGHQSVLSLSHRALSALAEVGLAEHARNLGKPLFGRMTHEMDSSISCSKFDTRGNSCIAVNRRNLNILLVNEAEKRGVQIYFGYTCEDVDLQTGLLRLAAPDGQEVQVPADIIVGADGADSAVRAVMQRQKLFEYSQQLMQHGYKELLMPATVHGRYAMNADVVHVWPRGDILLTALPNYDHTFSCMLFMPLEGLVSFASLRTDAAILATFARLFPDAAPLFGPTLAAQYFQSQPQPILHVRCNPLHAGNPPRVVIVGDASHAVVPFAAQGLNAGLEDCAVLAHALDDCNNDVARALQLFSRTRKPDIDAMTSISLSSFQENRETNSPLRTAQRRLDRFLHWLMPSIWQPLFSLVQFSSVSYVEVLKRTHYQDITLNLMLDSLLLLALFLALHVLQRAPVARWLLDLLKPYLRQWLRRYRTVT